MIDLEKLKRDFYRLYQTAPRLFRAPGRVNLIGEHTDHDGGFVLPMAIDRAVFVAAAPNESDRLRVRSVNLDDAAEIDFKSDYRPKSSWTNYIEGMARVLREKGVKIGGADLLIVSDVPTGAGLSSSAALETAVGLALAATSGSEIDRTSLALAGQEVEHRFIGVNCGIMDQFTSANAVGGHALLIDCLNLEFEAVPFDMSGTAVVICDSRVKHDLATSAYNERRSDYEQGIEILQMFYPRLEHLRDISSAEFEKHEDEIPEPSRKRTRHVVGENERALRSAEFLRGGDLGSFGKLMWKSHASLRDDYEVSCLELDFLVECAAGLETIVLGSRMTGGGFGGSTVSLVRRGGVDKFTGEVSSQYFQKFGIEPNFIISEAAGGAAEISR